MSTARASRFQFRDDVAALVTRSIVLVMMLCAVPLSARPPGTWSPKGNLSQARTSHTATLLANGKVLIVGGKDINGQVMPTAELYDPAKNTMAGSWYLRKLIGRYGNTDNPLAYALADYNAGRNNVLAGEPNRLLIVLY